MRFEPHCSCALDVGRLAQGLAGTDIKGTEKIWFKPHTALPPSRTATYLRIVADPRPQKAEFDRVRWTVGWVVRRYAV